MGFERKKRSIIWLCIDGLRGDSFRSAGNETVPENAIDKLMTSGAFFPNCIAAAQSTMPSCASFFTGMTPDLCRVPTQTANCIPQFHPDAVTLADILKHHGYRTYRWDDMNTYSCHPKSGFDVYEGGYGSLLETPSMSFDAEKRDAFLKRFANHGGHKFLYMHLDHLHEFGGESASVWNGEKYLHHVQEVAAEVESIIAKLPVDDECIVLINSDHGVTLNEDFAVFEKRHGGSFAEARIRVPAIFHCKGIEPRTLTGVIGNIDLSPTLLDMVGIDDMKAMGVSLLPVLSEGAEREGKPIDVQWAIKPTHQHVIGGECPGSLDSVCFRDNGWKYTVFSDGRKMLVDLRPGSEDLVDVLGSNPERVARYDSLYREMYEGRPESPGELYARTGMTFDKSAIVPDVSMLMPVHRGGVAMRKALVSLIDQIGYFEILVLDADETGRARAVCDDYDDDYRIRRVPVAGQTLGEMLETGFNASRGTYVATVSPAYRYTEDFIYTLRRAVEGAPDSEFAYCDGYQFYQDPRGKEYSYIGPSHFYINGSIGSDGVGSRVYSGMPSQQRLQEFNFIGDVAFFTRSLVERAGGFVSGTSLKKMWERMIRLTAFTYFPSPMIIGNGPMTGRPFMDIPEPQADAKVSVLVYGDDPVRLSLLLRSLRQQTMQDFEVVMATRQDRVSRIAAIAEEFTALDMQLCVVNEMDDMASLYGALLTHANGTFVTWCPAEAVLPDTYLENLVRPMVSEDAPLFTTAGTILAKGSVLDRRDGAEFTLASLWKGPRQLSGLLYKLSLHERIGLFHSRLGNAAAWDMLLRIMECGQGVPVEDAPLFLGTPAKDAVISHEDRKTLYRSAMNRMGGELNLAQLNYDIFLMENFPAGIQQALERVQAIFYDVQALREMNPRVA